MRAFVRAFLCVRACARARACVDHRAHEYSEREGDIEGEGEGERERERQRVGRQPGAGAVCFLGLSRFAFWDPLSSCVGECMWVFSYYRLCSLTIECVLLLYNSEPFCPPVQVCACGCVSVHTDIQTYIHANVHACIHTFIHTYMCVCVCVCVCARARACVHGAPCRTWAGACAR